LGTVLRRRWAGRYLVDPFGFDPQVADIAAPIVTALVRVDIEGAERLPPGGPIVLVANRGLGVAEPTAVAVAVRSALGRRARVVGLPGLPFADGLARRFGAIPATPVDLRAALRLGHVVVVPLAPTWLRTGAGMSPLPLMQAMLGAPVFPVAVRAAGPFGAPTRWRVEFAPEVGVDTSYEVDDPLAVAELGEAVRRCVGEMLSRPADGPVAP
jgi:1-acyl-sn-glycerol-3-phosphate acyltransferase